MQGGGEKRWVLCKMAELPKVDIFGMLGHFLEKKGGNMKTHFVLLKEFFPVRSGLSISKITALIVLILCLGISSAWGAKPGPKIYVNASAADDGDGKSWATAFNDLQDALAAAEFGDEIWVAAGTYKPTETSDRSVSFVLKSGVKIYGGFAGDETRLNERRLDPSLTVLSGDIGTIGDDTDNSNHVVYAYGVTDAVLDGFTVTRGRGDSASAGAGMYTENSALTVSNCIFSHNKVGVNSLWGGQGGGMFNRYSAPIVTNCTFSDNQAGNTSASAINVGSGGGMYNVGYYGSSSDPQWPVITGCTFSDNIASSRGETLGGGGGIYNYLDCSPTIDRCTFERNLAGRGGGMLNYTDHLTITNCIFDTNSTTYAEGLGGAIYSLAHATIQNCIFYQNGWRLLTYGEPLFRPFTAKGGAIYDDIAGSAIANCIFLKNAARADGGALAAYATSPKTTLINSLFYENIDWQGSNDPSNAVTSHVIGVLNTLSANNLYDINPLLVDPAGGDFHLSYDSPCIDAGYAYKHHRDWYSPFFYPTDKVPAEDFYGDHRIVDGDGDGETAVDIGVDEFIPNLPDLKAFLQGLADSGELDEATAARLIAYVDEALAAGNRNAKRTSLNELIADAEASLGSTETGQVIAQKTEAVIESLD